jgi:putative nucleotidyltransferase with HDIG domain
VALEIRDLRVPLGQGIVGNVALSGVAEVVNDVEADPRWVGDGRREFRTRAILTVPLMSRGSVVGVLQLLNPIDKEVFAADDLRRVGLFAGALGIALENARLYAAQKQQFIDTVTALAEAVEKRDPYTGGHVRRVVGYSLLLGIEMNLDAEELEGLRLAAILHDIGKIAVPDIVLRKPAPLDPEEATVMRRHTTDGAEIVSRIRQLRPLLAGVRNHHERLDGKGYPDALKGAEIPLAARIIAVADTFDAMTTDRPYRQGLTPEEAAEEILRGEGTQFCPIVVKAFNRLFERRSFTVPEGRRVLESLTG